MTNTEPAYADFSEKEESASVEDTEEAIVEAIAKLADKLHEKESLFQSRDPFIYRRHRFVFSQLKFYLPSSNSRAADMDKHHIDSFLYP